MTGQARRGQPLVALVVLLAAWVGARGMIRDVAEEEQASGGLVAAQAPKSRPFVVVTRGRTTTTDLAQAGRLASVAGVIVPPGAAYPRRDTLAVPLPSRADLIAPPAPAFAPIAPPPDRRLLDPRLAGGHKLLWLAALAQLPLPDEAMKAYRSVRAQPPPAVLAAAGQPWSADGWLMLRGGGQGAVIAGTAVPSYGASQAGLVVRYRLPAGRARQASVYLRASAPTGGRVGKELAVGLGARALAALPVVALAELRATDAGAQVALRPAGHAGQPDRAAAPDRASAGRRLRRSGLCRRGIVQRLCGGASARGARTGPAGPTGAARRGRPVGRGAARGKPARSGADSIAVPPIGASQRPTGGRLAVSHCRTR